MVMIVMEPISDIEIYTVLYNGQNMESKSLWKSI